MALTLVQELDELHAAYVVAINEAVEDGDTTRAAELAASYDADAVELIAEREGKQHLLPLVLGRRPTGRMQRLLARLTHQHA